MKSNSDTYSQKLLKQKLDALVKAGDEMRRILGVSVACGGTPQAKLKIRSMIDEWDAAKKPFQSKP